MPFNLIATMKVNYYSYFIDTKAEVGTFYYSDELKSATTRAEHALRKIIDLI